jgi:hypothetical protein
MGWKKIKSETRGDKEEKATNAITELAKISINFINSMSPLDIAMSNIHFDFGESDVLYKKAVKCVERVAKKHERVAKKHDPRSLTISFSNELTVHGTYDWEKGIRSHVCPYNPDVVMEAMGWLTGMAIKYTPYRVKWCCRIPKEALETLNTFRGFSEEFDMDNKPTVEDLVRKGWK